MATKSIAKKKAPAKKSLAQSNAPFHLNHVRLRGYRTIKDCSVDFKPGLNIIIGKNGAGKTNFVELLFQTLWGLKRIKEPVICEYEFVDGRSKYRIIAKNELNATIGHVENTTSFRLINKKGEQAFTNPFEMKFNSSIVAPETRIIKHGTHLDFDIPLISKSISIKLPDANNILEYFDVYKTPYFIIYILSYFVVRSFNPDGKTDESIIKEFLDTLNPTLDKLSAKLRQFSPIKAVKINPNFKLYRDKDTVTIDGLIFDFHLTDSIVPYSYLSDGTKRIFNIIAECAVPEINFDSQIHRICFIEEPEIGIHPHQLQLLLDFLKTQSKERQIIITTHSPQVLDILAKDELNRIIICDYNSEEGTQMRKLNNKQISKAKAYMENEAFLSDYWRFSDLES